MPQPSNRLRLTLTHLLPLAIIVAAAVAIAACRPPTLPSTSSQPNSPSSPTVTLSPLRQLVEFKPAASDEWLPVNGEVALEAGDTIRTSVGGIGFIRFGDGTSTEVHPETILTIDEYINDAGQLTIELAQIAGQTLNRVRADDETVSKHTLTAPPATIDVTGTAYWSTVEVSGRTILQTTEGKLYVIPDADDMLLLEAGQCLIVEPDGTLGPDCNDIPLPEAFTTGEPSELAALFEFAVDLSNCGDAVCQRALGENRFSCGLDCEAPRCGDRICDPNESVATCATDCLRLNGEVCGNNSCKPGNGEDYVNCQADCKPPALFCGDGLCSDQIGEDLFSCATDCAPEGFCGDGLCSAETGENRRTCAVDCGPPGRCGDGICDPNRDENEATCADDCLVPTQTASPCGDGICDPDIGEDDITCSLDCVIVLTPVCGDGTCDAGEDATSCSADCAAAVCGDGTCDPTGGEDATSCAADCATPPAPVCGDGTCDAGEDATSCSADCAAPVCGDGTCDAGEDATSCSADCTAPPAPVCGDGTCDAGEDATSCSADCTAPPAPVCGDGTCDAGEDATSCSADCTAPPAPVCGDSVCDASEDTTTCPADCTCGDGICDLTIGEDASTCAFDCGVCGDGICSAPLGEDNITCAADCPSAAAISGYSLAACQPVSDAQSESVCEAPTSASNSANPLWVWLLRATLHSLRTLTAQRFPIA